MYTKERKLEPITKAFITQAIQEVLEDIDFGLEFTERAKRRLRNALMSKKKTPFSEIKKKYYN